MAVDKLAVVRRGNEFESLLFRSSVLDKVH